MFNIEKKTLLLIKKRRLTDATGDLLSKNFAIFIRKHMCWSSPITLLKRDPNKVPVNIWKFLKKQFWRTSAYACFWRDFKKWLIRTFFLSGKSLSKTSRLSNITKIPFAFKPGASLNLTPTLYFGLRFPIFIIDGYDRKANACSPWTSCWFIFN